MQTQVAEALEVDSAALGNTHHTPTSFTAGKVPGEYGKELQQRCHMFALPEGLLPLCFPLLSCQTAALHWPAKLTPFL